MTLSGDTPPRRRREGWCELRLENCGLDKWGGIWGRSEARKQPKFFQGRHTITARVRVLFFFFHNDAVINTGDLQETRSR